MSDFRLGVQASAAPTQYVDNELVTYNDGTTQAIRQRVRIGGAAGTDLAKVFMNGSLQVGYDNEAQAAQNITASSGAGANTAAGLANATYTGGSVVIFQTSEDHSSIQIQISGTWSGTLQTERTLDGNFWFPTNVRRNAAGNQIANQLTQNGLYVGTYATTYQYRVRALTGFSGTATVAFSAGTQAGTFLLSEVTTVTESQYFASSAGNNSAWGVCSQEVTLATANTEYPVLWLFNNDATGGRVLYLMKTQKTASTATKIRRYRTGPGGTQMTRASGGTLLTINNRANQSATATAAVAYNGPGLVINNQPTYFEKMSYVGQSGANNTGVVETDEQGSILVPPQTGILWAAAGLTNNAVVSIEVAYWDGLTLP